MQYSTLLLTTLCALTTPSFAQQAADGPLVPFTSVLPSCASQCGPLYDVQGGCSDNSCFCADARLQSFKNQGTAGVSQVCGPTSCTSDADLQAIKTWYSGKCGGSNGGTPTISSRTGGSTSRPSGSSSTTPRPNNGSSSASSRGGGSWIDTHKQWLIMAVVLVIGIPALWVGAWLLRKRHLRKKEREIEMNPPASWGPHHAHGGNGLPPQESNVMSGGAGGHHKEMARDSTIPGRRLTKGKMGWFKASKQ